jgi:hypothetical protein
MSGPIATSSSPGTTSPISGLGLLTPHDVHYGLADQRVAARATTLATAYAIHPERFPRGLPQPPGQDPLPPGPLQCVLEVLLRREGGARASRKTSSALTRKSSAIHHCSSSRSDLASASSIVASP